MPGPKPGALPLGDAPSRIFILLRAKSIVKWMFKIYFKLEINFKSTLLQTYDFQDFLCIFDFLKVIIKLYMYLII